jgi:hypothetical protein
VTSGRPVWQSSGGNDELRFVAPAVVSSQVGVVALLTLNLARDAGQQLDYVINNYIPGYGALASANVRSVEQASKVTASAAHHERWLDDPKLGMLGGNRSRQSFGGWPRSIRGHGGRVGSPARTAARPGGERDAVASP